MSQEGFTFSKDKVSVDKKITIGTDYPEYTYQDVFKRVKKFCKGLSQEKIDNI